jgi:hypothetical protein
VSEALDLVSEPDPLLVAAGAAVLLLLPLSDLAVASVFVEELGGASFLEEEFESEEELDFFA